MFSFTVVVVYHTSPSLTLQNRLEEIIPEILPIVLFLMDLPIIPKTATYYSQCDHLNTEITTVLELP